jgi:tRNA A58 N-methylase Trm61
VFTKFRIIYWIRRLRRGKFYEKEIGLLSCLISSRSIVIDIGVDFRQYAYSLSKLVGPTGRVFSFEPARYTFEILKKH